jgi:hypothetical protein
MVPPVAVCRVTRIGEDVSESFTFCRKLSYPVFGLDIVDIARNSP